MDIEVVRTFVAASEAGQFQAAADELNLTQQAVSKRIASLERQLGVSLFARTARGALLSLDGQAFLPHAKELLQAASRAIESVQPKGRALRVDVLNRRITPSALIYDFHRLHPEFELDIVTLGAGIDAAAEAVNAGTIDMSFRALIDDPLSQWPDLTSERVFNSRLELLLGPKHPLAAAKWLTPNDLQGHRIWIPGIERGTEWEKFYKLLVKRFGLSVDHLGPHFGDEALLEELAGSSTIATLIGERDRYLWPARFNLRRIPLVDPAPSYPYSLIWRRNNPHPALAALLKHFPALRGESRDKMWVPGDA